MNEQERYLFRHTATRENGADLTATRPGPGPVLVSPITPAPTPGCASTSLTART